MSYAIETFREWRSEIRLAAPAPAVPFEAMKNLVTLRVLN
jgi:hypothetical protein